MKGKITIYVDPANRVQAANELRSVTGSDIQFYPDEHKFLSWVGEAEIEVSDQKEAFGIERDLQKSDTLKDVEIIVEDSPEEDEINYRYAQLNESINEAKVQYPHPYWYKHAIYFEDALEFARKAFSNGTGHFNENESSHKIALIDTGYTDHPEIGLINKNGYNFMPGEDSRNPIDTLENTRPIPIRWGGHGTSCSGLIIGTQAVIPPVNRIPRKKVFFEDINNGLMPGNIELIPFRVSKNIISFHSRMANAISAIARSGMIDVISMSHASLMNRKVYYAATREAYEKGIVLVAAPGSHVFGSKKVFTYPARYDETIAPAATRIQNVPWELTHGGPEVDLCAPGFEMYIPFPYKEKGVGLGYGYKWSEGSSFAVPIIATAAALWRMHHGKKLEVFSAIEQVELFRSIIRKTATPFSEPVPPGLYGSGIINFREMLAAPLPDKVAGSKSLTTEVRPESIFTVNKQEATMKRELAWLKTMQFLNNQSKSISEPDFYFQNGTPEFKLWIEGKIKGEPDGDKALDLILDSQL
jgi:hypothetical protein